MYDVLVVYGKPSDEAAFDAYFEGRHIALVAQLPAVQDFAWGKVERDGPDNPYLVARLTYASKDDAEASLASDIGSAAVADVENFADGGLDVLYVQRSA